MDVEFSVSPIAAGGNAFGVFIDGVPYRLEGEPPPYPPSVHIVGSGQR